MTPINKLAAFCKELFSRQEKQIEQTKEKRIVERNQAHKRDSGFTLIELLVVISIIAVLAAILFPVFSRARENARRSSCLSNLKQLGLGAMMYTQDYDEKYPPGIWRKPGTTGNAPENFVAAPSPHDGSTPAKKFSIDAGAGSGRLYSWMDFIYPYVKSVQLFVCPSLHSQSDTYPSYGYNLAISRQRSIPPTPLSMAAISRPSEIVMFLDYPNRANYANPHLYCGTALTDTSSLWYVHLGGGNITFADGHAKWYKMGSEAICGGKTGSGTDNTQQRAWTPSLP